MRCLAKGSTAYTWPPYNCHSYLLPLVTDTLSVFDERCKRSTRFIVSCVVQGSALVRSVARYGSTVARYNSFIGSNALFCCDRYRWSLDDLIRSNINLPNFTVFNSRLTATSYIFGLLSFNLDKCKILHIGHDYMLHDYVTTSLLSLYNRTMLRTKCQLQHRKEIWELSLLTISMCRPSVQKQQKSYKGSEYDSLTVQRHAQGTFCVTVQESCQTIQAWSPCL